MRGIHRIDNRILIAEYCQIDDVAFRGDVCVKFQFAFFLQSEDEECGHPKTVS